MAKANRSYRPTLIVYVVWHPRFKRGAELADSFFAHLSRDPAHPTSRGLGISVRFRSAPASGTTGLPSSVPFDAAHKSAVVVLVDNEMIADLAWCEYVRQLRQASQDPENHSRLLPVALTEHARNLDPQVAEVQFIRLHEHPEESQTELILNRITHECCRFMLNRPRLIDDGSRSEESPPVKVFLSHAKAGGLDLAQGVRDYIYRETHLHAFFDARDIPPGSEWARILKEECGRCALLVLQTDLYASREWCQIEVLTAKRNLLPMVVVNAITHGEKRSFPYLGNVPTIRWPVESAQPYETILGLLLREVLRHAYFCEQFKEYCHLHRLPEGARPMAYPPELLTALDLRNGMAEVFVYPDPPLGAEELRLLSDFDAKLRLSTPILAAADDSRVSGLIKWKVAVSISESPDLDGLGLGHVHLEDAFVEIARHLLARGASLYFGGDHRLQQGFTHILFDLVRDYDLPDKPPTERVRNFLAWPLHLRLTTEQRARLRTIAEVEEVPPPAGLNVDPQTFIEPATAEHSFIWACSLTAMRERMTAEMNARVLLGGRVLGHKGKYPGLAEEAHLAIRAGKPLYLLGGFGGCTNAVIQAILGKTCYPLTMEFQRQNVQFNTSMDFYNQRRTETPIDYDSLVADFQKAGVAGLRNGLENEDNYRLFETDDVSEMTALVLKGLHNLATS